MMNVIKDYVMVNQLDDRANYMTIDTDLRSARANVKLPEAEVEATSSVHLSQTSKQVEALKALILSAPEINAAKTAFIKEAIAEGRYSMNHEKIAQKMLAEV